MNKDIKLLHDKHALEQKIGLKTELLEKSKLSELGFPEHVNAGTFSTKEGFIIPEKLSSIVINHLQLAQSEKKIALYQNMPIINISHQNANFDIRLHKGESLRSKYLVSALGAWTPWISKMLGLDSFVQSYPIQMASLANSHTKIPCFTRYINGRLSIKRVSNDKIFIGGGWPAIWDDQHEKLIIHTNNLLCNLNLACQIFPDLGDSQLTNCWGNHVAWTVDGLPIIGESLKIPGLFLACGGNGYTLGPLYAEILSSLIINQKYKFPLDMFSEQRFSAHQISSSALKFSITTNNQTNLLTQWITQKKSIRSILDQTNFEPLNEPNVAFNANIQPD